MFNYLFDPQNKPARLTPLFRRIYNALQPGGVFLFDVSTPGRVPGGRSRGCFTGTDWACMAEAEEDSRRHLLTRRITSFRKVGETYRRDDEIHQLRLYKPGELIRKLRDVGFRVRVLKGYGELRFPIGHVGFLARKETRVRRGGC